MGVKDRCELALSTNANGHYIALAAYAFLLMVKPQKGHERTEQVFTFRRVRRPLGFALIQGVSEAPREQRVSVGEPFVLCVLCVMHCAWRAV